MARILHGLQRFRTIIVYSSSYNGVPANYTALENLLSPKNYQIFSDFHSHIAYRSFSWWNSSGNPNPQADNHNGGLVCKLSEDLGRDADVSSRRFDAQAVAEGAEALAESSGKGIEWYFPVDGVIGLLDGLHGVTGLPWWAVITTSTLALRMTLFPILVLRLKQLEKISVLFPKLPPIPNPFSGGNFQEQFVLFQKERKAIGCPSLMWNFAAFAVQAPCFILWMMSIRRMSLNHHPGFDSGGMSWFQDLTQYPHGDLAPMFPIIVAALHFANVQVSFATVKVGDIPGLLGLITKYYKLWLNIMTLPIFFIGFCIPQGSLLYWFTNSSLTLVQQILLKQPYILKYFGLRANLGNPALRVPKEKLDQDDLLVIAYQQLASGHQEKALSLLRIALEQDPEMTKAMIAIGEILLSRKLLPEAAENFERAIAKAKDGADSLLIAAYFGAGVSYFLQGSKSVGIEYLKKVTLFKEPEDPWQKACYYKAFVTLGSALFQEGLKGEAMGYLRRAAEYDSAVMVYVKECENDENTTTTVGELTRWVFNIQIKASFSWMETIVCEYEHPIQDHWPSKGLYFWWGMNGSGLLIDDRETVGAHHKQ
ncbi:ALBINO3-like protein 2, chloroplastic isoform X2 [Amborella trichopoda]|uniref:ALBINO3-like protein 2, chloroplastic isoform X1 n=1 Tax=Amborella trichopoda TaxID=13333 RepID=UPI0009BF62A5|nr:ALBINO3-like protein 2, chloroplastic isoform X1 [Amborella trichopoda]XP_020522969.1 ALBINO3-like protein 2, chloroplastic isoform X2 [Amborella trichopoda]|eukprot:XP_020522967.1 ALBINO3-like protein 2, chloroplastic isoform X1 [Amborella trichopoda]